ncbi:MAG TPA: diacylglycerol kinase family protein, partial [Thermoleophilaceae bacterium]|nr:diacylglycerol kinase family protein [Thermoleophilaceae bacterium]
ASATLPLAVIPAGTANDFARRLGLPSEVPEACRLAALGGRTRRLELAWMEPLDSSGERRPFVNVASAGLPAPAARAARSWKRTLGSAAYAAGALAAGLTARPVSARVEVDERELFTGRAWQVTVAASGAFGAGAAVEEADPADGALDVVAIPAGPRAGLVALAYHLRSGGITDHSPARHARCRRAVVEVAPGTPFNVDGELVPFGPARFGVTPAAYELVVG